VTSVPLLASVVLLFGCCVLPFHSVIHKAMPYCHVAIGMMRGDHRQQERSAPARAKQETPKRMATTAPRTFRPAIARGERPAAPAGATTYRSFISLGALRCDQDVGLHLRVSTLLIIIPPP